MTELMALLESYDAIAVEQTRQAKQNLRTLAAEQGLDLYGHKSGRGELVAAQKSGEEYHTVGLDGERRVVGAKEFERWFIKTTK